ncbi:hypothetical protein IT41_13650 [Paracoccus halophilus]|uniref:Uncharacterized protein n=1 Tax=Paracoccus halophilus TaxID=376733 RepID=A0A099F0I0_9RHOB|nr:hypothetical protein IT41_13650 [Paracoccus halophilus]
MNFPKFGAYAKQPRLSLVYDEFLQLNLVAGFIVWRKVSANFWQCMLAQQYMGPKRGLAGGGAAHDQLCRHKSAPSTN